MGGELRKWVKAPSQSFSLRACVFADVGVWVRVVDAEHWGRVRNGNKQAKCEKLGDVRTLWGCQNLLSAFSSCNA